MINIGFLSLKNNQYEQNTPKKGSGSGGSPEINFNCESEEQEIYIKRNRKKGQQKISIGI